MTTPTLAAPDYRTSAHVAVYAAMCFAVAALLVDWVGCTVEGYAGIVFGTTAFGMAVMYAVQHDRQQRKTAAQGGVQ
jgi:hypothetical protein